jgi:hypothetical protein
MAKTTPKTPAGKQRKIAEVLHEFKADALHSSSGKKVTNPKQALAISLSEAGVPPKAKKGKKNA